MEKKSNISKEQSLKMSLDEYIEASGIKDTMKEKRKIYGRQDEPMDLSDISREQSLNMSLDELIASSGKGSIKQKRRRYRRRRDEPMDLSDIDPSLPEHRRVGQYYKNRRRNNKSRQNAIFSGGLCDAMISNPLVNKITSEIVGDMMTMIMTKWGAPKYDMKLQKNISELQGKPLCFSSATGYGEAKKVVSGDGNGIEDCAVKATTTDSSLHQRFA